MSQDRRGFLKLAGFAGAASLIPFARMVAKEKGQEESMPGAGECVLIPSETAGPFPLDLSANTYYFRQDVRENEDGVPFNLKLKIIGQGNCLPMSNVRVNIWHCSRLGVYSGYDEANNPDQEGLTYLRGYQMTDANGEVEFFTIFPGWYNGRICHIHFQVYVSSNYSAVSQLTFELDAKNAIYTANPSLYPNGVDPLDFDSDNIFEDGYAYQLATLSANEETGGYNGYLEVTIQGNGTSGLEEKLTAKQFVLGQNYPNPFKNETTIPFTLKNNSDVTMELFDLSGKKVFVLEKKGLTTGEHLIPLDFSSMGLPVTNYIYQLVVTNSNGEFKTYKMMTAMK